MHRIKEVLRLRYELGLGQRQIARSCSIGQSTVLDYLKRAEAAGLRWPLRDDWDDERLERSLFAYCQHEQPSPQRPEPDFESIHEQLKRHSNLRLPHTSGHVAMGLDHDQRTPAAFTSSGSGIDAVADVSLGAVNRTAHGAPL